MVSSVLSRKYPWKHCNFNLYFSLMILAFIVLICFQDTVNHISIGFYWSVMTVVCQLSLCKITHKDVYIVVPWNISWHIYNCKIMFNFGTILPTVEDPYLSLCKLRKKKYPQNGHKHLIKINITKSLNQCIYNSFKFNSLNMGVKHQSSLLILHFLVAYCL